MDQLRLSVSDLAYLAPELTLVISAVVLSLLDLIMPKQLNRSLLGWLALIGIVISAIFVASRLGIQEAVVLLDQSYRVDDFANWMKLFFLVGTGLILFMSIGSVKEKDVPHTGEFYYLFLPAVLGAMVMASSGDLITLYVGLELLSITSYILVGMRKHHLRSNEAAMKYIVLGSISSAFILYGMSFLYGITGSTNIATINAGLNAVLSNYQALVYVSFFLMFVGFAFKIAAAPFHMWAPDVYQGAPTPVTAFLATVSKAAGFAILFRMFYSIYYGIGSPDVPHMGDDVYFALAVLAAITMIVGNFMALKQRNMKRLLALSGAANSGYLLVPIATQFSMFHYSNFAELYYYMIAYLFMNIGALAVFMAVSEASGNEETRSFAGLYYRAPYTAVAMVILILSLSGIPVTGGFFGKLYILLGTLQLRNYWLGLIMIITSVASFYYYFGIIRQMFMRTSEVAKQITIPIPLGLTIWISAAATVLMGLFPSPILRWIEGTFSLVSDFFIR